MANEEFGEIILFFSLTDTVSSSPGYHLVVQEPPQNFTQKRKNKQDLISTEEAETTV